MHVLTLKYDSYRNKKVAGSADGHLCCRKQGFLTGTLKFYKKTAPLCASHVGLELSSEVRGFFDRSDQNVFFHLQKSTSDRRKKKNGEGFVCSLYFF